MPLVHYSDVHEVERFVGVRFIMKDATDSAKRVTCLVTYAALQDRAALDGHAKHWMSPWREHQSTIEALASDNYDKGKLRRHSTDHMRQLTGSEPAPSFNQAHLPAAQFRHPVRE
jgi:hypothetical protein